jgi:hypothetical protein
MLPIGLGLFVIGCAVPVYRHGRWGVAGVAAGWFGVTAALIIVAKTPPMLACTTDSDGLPALAVHPAS